MFMSTIFARRTQNVQNVFSAQCIQQIDISRSANGDSTKAAQLDTDSPIDV